jgi:hypothetical protein
MKFLTGLFASKRRETQNPDTEVQSREMQKSGQHFVS